MLKKQLDTKFRNLSKKEQTEVSGGSFRQRLLDIVELIDTMNSIKNYKKIPQKDKIEKIPLYYLMRDLGMTIQNI